MNWAWRLTILGALQLLVLVYMIADRQWTLATGIPVILDTEPVDPRSLFSGDYVRLRYKLNRLAPAELGGDREFVRGETVYVLLQAEGPSWRAVSLHRTMPRAAAQQMVLRGQIVNAGTAVRDRLSRVPVEARYLEVRYGIESYFVPEGEGRALEQPQAGETVTIRVAVDARGRAAIQALLVNGKERYVEQLF